MALFTDGRVIDTEDLRAYESSILNVAKAEGIDLGSKIDVAQREVAVDILRYLTERTAIDLAPPSVALNQVVATELLANWLVHRTLEMVFRDCYHNQLNDRYKAKWSEYERQALAAAERFFDVGPGIVETPVARGERPLVEAAPGVMESGFYQIAIAWQNAAGQIGAPTEVLIFESAEGTVPRVTAGASPQYATAWHVYAAPIDRTLQRQNDAPIAGPEWEANPDGFVTGEPIGAGQSPDYYLRRQRLL